MLKSTPRAHALNPDAELGALSSEDEHKVNEPYLDQRMSAYDTTRM